MKARDLAALAALGVAGYAAYNKFGKKDEAKPRGKLGESQSANDGTAGEYRSDMLGQGRSANEGDAGESEARMSKRSRQENDVPEKIVSRQERDVPDRIMGRDAAGSRFTDKAAAVQDAYGAETMRKGVQSGDGGAAARALLKNKSSGTVAVKPAVSAPAATEAVESKRPMGENAAGSRFTSRDATPEQRIADIDAKSGASHSSTKKTEELAAYSKEQAAKDLEKKKKNGTFVPIPQNVKPAVTTPTAVAPTPPLSAAAAAKKRAIDESNFDSDLMKGRRQAVVDTLQGIPSGIANIFKPKEKEFQNKTYRDFSGNIVKYAKGGVVKKMASGGMTSSKMSSKPSTASSRGDGIAQRGKTRGMIR